ncbi:hypothetical protein [Okeania sp. SIO1I7]|uniref:IS1096 element passenger TnpR family protein n=1 Tax=Okeania sp. SIO1I7 TaxID=2607772 RepID=UPI0013F8A8A1|nr:plasmid pRiA4b ORF-3 family protein [Okeania sp. SIO1I7]
MDKCLITPNPLSTNSLVVLQGISPMIWRRLLVKSDSTIENLHYILQIGMGWEDIHLHSNSKPPKLLCF